MEPNEATVQVNPAITPLMEEAMVDFKYAHLAPHLQDVSRPFGALAKMIFDGPHNRQALLALDALCIAKDRAVRAVLHETLKSAT